MALYLKGDLGFRMDGSRTNYRLNDITEFDCPFRVNPDKSVETELDGIYAPDVLMPCHEDSQILDEDEEDFKAQLAAQGWKALEGWTGQYLYHGLVMHPSEYLGGELAEHVLDNPGVYCLITAEVDGEDEEPAGWVILRKVDDDV